MTAQEKCIIETILAEVGLEPLYIGGNDHEQNKAPEKIAKTSR